MITIEACSELSEDQLKNLIHGAINRFIVSSDHEENLSNDDDFNQLMQAPDISSVLHNDPFLIQDAIYIGIAIGFRMGMVNTAIQVAQAAELQKANNVIDIFEQQSTESDGEKTIEIDSDGITYV